MTIRTALLLATLLSIGCKDAKAEKDLADAKKSLADKEEDLEASQKKLKAAESAENAAVERAKLAEAKLKESDAKLKEAEAKLKAVPPSDVSDPTAPTTPSSGIPACDKYWATLKACNEAGMKNVPPAIKAEMQKAIDDAEKQTKEAWKGLDNAALTKACEMMVDALKNNPNCPKQ